MSRPRTSSGSPSDRSTPGHSYSRPVRARLPSRSAISRPAPGTVAHRSPGAPIHPMCTPANARPAKIAAQSRSTVFAGTAAASGRQAPGSRCRTRFPADLEEGERLAIGRPRTRDISKSAPAQVLSGAAPIGWLPEEVQRPRAVRYESEPGPVRRPDRINIQLGAERGPGQSLAREVVNPDLTLCLVNGKAMRRSSGESLGKV